MDGEWDYGEDTREFDGDYDIWVDFHEIDDKDDIVSLVKFAHVPIKVGQRVSMGDEEGARAYGTITKIGEELVTIRLDRSTKEEGDLRPVRPSR